MSLRWLLRGTQRSPRQANGTDGIARNLYTARRRRRAGLRSTPPGHELGTRTPDAEACPAARAHPGLARRDVSARGHVFSGHSGSTG